MRSTGVLQCCSFAHGPFRDIPCHLIQKFTYRRQKNSKSQVRRSVGLLCQVEAICVLLVGGELHDRLVGSYAAEKCNQKANLLSVLYTSVLGSCSTLSMPRTEKREKLL